MRSRGTAPVKAKAGAPPASEQALAELWQNAHALSEELITQDGDRLRVVYPGRARSRAGPDFLDAIIETADGEVVTGDVELHLNAPDWYHHTDANYNSVVLHVVLQPRGRRRSRCSSPGEKRLLCHWPAPRSRCVDAARHGGRDLGQTLDRAGDARFLSKSRGFVLELARTDADPDQTLYAAIMEALGYASNRRPFRELANRVPIGSLRWLKGEPAGTRAFVIKAIMLRTSGLLSDVDPAEARQMRALERQLPTARRMSRRRWTFFRIRPTNHPALRVAGAAALVDRYLETGMTAGLIEVVRHGDADALLASLTAPPFVGKARAGDVAVNVVLPYLHAHSAAARRSDLAQACTELYHAFPRLEENEITRETLRLLRSRTTISGARRQQGLIHLFKEMVRGARGRPV